MKMSPADLPEPALLPAIRGAASIAKVIIADECPAVDILDAFKLEPRLRLELTTIGDGVFDRRELQKVVLAFARTVEQ